MRPFVGFIVEGDGESRSFRSIAAKVLGVDTSNLPVANAGGCGGLVKYLEERLDEMVRVHHPSHVIATLDRRDFRKTARFPSCAELRAHLQARADMWLVNGGGDRRLSPLPDSVTVVIQDATFESWLIADLEGVRTATDLVVVEEEVVWTNVDTEVGNPSAWLAARVAAGVDHKNALFPKKLLKHLDVNRIEQRSRSFRKFVKELRRCYGSAA